MKLDSPDAVLILGDFNDKCNKWSDNHIASELGNKLVELSESRNVDQLIKEPTRYNDNSESLLDLIFCYAPCLIMDSGVTSPLSNLDHCTIFCKLNIKSYKQYAYYCEVWDYKTADFTELNNSLSTAPFSTAFLVFDDTDDIIQYTYDLLFSTLREHIINKVVTIRPKDKPWMSNEVRRALRFRDRAFSRYKKVPTDENKLRFIIARREANRLKR